MKNSVIIKGVQSGIVVVLDKNLEYEKLKRDITEKFKTSSKFLGDADVAINFEGRELTDEQIEDVLEVIEKNTKLNVVCVLSKNERKNAMYQRKIEENIKLAIDKKNKDNNKEKDAAKEEKTSLAVKKTEDKKSPGSIGMFHKGSLRSGQALEMDTSVVVIGDVNYGANIVSKGNVIVLGTLFGNVHAGSGGSKDAFVIALDMQATQIRIGNVIARSSDSQEHIRDKETKIAYVENERIYIEKINRSVIKDLKM